MKKVITITYVLISSFLLASCDETQSRQSIEPIIIYKTDTVYIEKDVKKSSLKEEQKVEPIATVKEDAKETNKTTEKTFKEPGKLSGPSYGFARQSEYNPNDYKDIPGGLNEAKGDPDVQLEQAQNPVNRLFKTKKKKH